MFLSGWVFFRDLKKRFLCQLFLSIYVYWINILLFIIVFFSYIESANSLSRETNIDVNRYEVADNVDLETVLMEYESYYYIKFSKHPKIVKKLTSQSGKMIHVPICELAYAL